MKLSEAIAHRIAQDTIGQGVGRDEKGLYVEWDSLELRPNGDLVLMYKDAVISTEHVFTRQVNFDHGESIHIMGFEGRLRVTAG